MVITKFKVGDIVTRKSYNNDIVFKILNISNSIVFLKGVDLRLYADSNVDDLVLSEITCDDDEIIEENNNYFSLDRDNYFYIPGKILHVDGDSEYLDRCMKFYKRLGINANGVAIDEKNIYVNIKKLLNDYCPDILVITGHDAYYSKNSNKNDLDNYESSIDFIKGVKEARKYEHNQDKLIIIAGACQSNYEALIKAGANFASSPKRINIHALDPAIVASSIAFSDRNQNINLLSILERTKYGCNGIGGLITNGTMYVGYPR